MYTMRIDDPHNSHQDLRDMGASDLGKNFWSRGNRSSHFTVFVAWDFDFHSFALADCGAAPGTCGLRTVGGASAGGLQPDGTRLDAMLMRARTMDGGALWQREPLPLERGFETSFTFRVSGGNVCAGGVKQDGTCYEDAKIGGDGFAYVIHSSDDGSDSLGCAGSARGLGSRLPECRACLGPALAIRFETHDQLRMGKHRLPTWEGRNQLRLVSDDCGGAAFGRERAGQLRTLQTVHLSPVVYLDDGSHHEVRIQYFQSELSVYINNELHMQVLVKLTRRHYPPTLRGSPPPPSTVTTPHEERDARNNPSHPLHRDADYMPSTAMHAAVLDRRGQAYLGFVASSGVLGHEQYEISKWSFRRTLRIPASPPQTEAEVAAIEALSGAQTAQAPAADAPDEDTGGLDGDIDGGSGDFGSGEFGSGFGSGESASGDSGSGPSGSR